MTTILVVEDERYLLEDIVELLQHADFDVLGVNEPDQVIHLAREMQPDLILCDIMMQKGTGFTVLDAIRAEPTTQAIPFIFLTAKADRDSLRLGMSHGADDYLTKPFSAHELLQAIHARLRRREQMAETHEQRIVATKRQLMRMITHELRTPLIAINTGVDLLSRQVGQLSETEMRDMLDNISAGSRRLGHRVEQMVFLTQIEAGAISQESIQEGGIESALWELLMTSNNAARRFAYRQQPNITVKLVDRDRGALVLCNPPALKQALAELIANALTFSPENGEVIITQWRTGDQAWISVLDQGSGMSEVQITAAMQPFTQLDRETQEQQGIGVGLPLAIQIVRAHGGVVDLRSMVGRGTQVNVMLPIVRQEAQNNAP